MKPRKTVTGFKNPSLGVREYHEQYEFLGNSQKRGHQALKQPQSVELV